MMLQREILFLALTRPALTWGVPFEALAANIMLSFFAGAELSAPTIWRSPMMFWAMSIPIHLALRQLTAWDYHWCRAIRLWALTLGRPSLESISWETPRHYREVPSSV